MKTLYTALFVLLSCAFLRAQIQRGDRLLTLNGDTEVSFDNFTANPLIAGNLGGIAFPGDFSAIVAYATPNYGFALTNRLIIGGGAVALLVFEDGETDGSFGVAPYLRYYFINREKLGVYAQASTSIEYGGGQLSTFDAYAGGIGLQIPVASGVRVGPSVDYVVGDLRNSLVLQGSIDLILGRNTRQETVPAASFKKGSVMLGGQYLSGTARKRLSSLGATLGGHYFFSDRFAGLLSLGVETFSADLGGGGSQYDIVNTTYSFILGSRYYFTTDRHLVWFGDFGGGYQFSRGHQERNSGKEKYKSDGSFLSLSGGAQLFIRENIALEAGPEYRRSFSDGEGTGLVLLNVGARFVL